MPLFPGQGGPPPEIGISVDVFGSLVTEMQPTDLPQGVSPDNQDIVYLPGSVSSRPGLQRIYNSLPAGATITYLKTFLPPDGNPLNLILDSFGNIWKEDVFRTPGTLTKVGNVVPGSYATSVTANGKEYFTFHDGGNNSTDIPRQYDGVNFDRVSQDGPGSNPCAVADFDAAGVVVTVTPIATLTISSAIQINGVATIETTAPHGMKSGDYVQIVGVGVPGYDNTGIAVQVTSVPDPSTFTYSLITGTPLAASSGGTAYPLKLVVVFNDDHGLISGDQFSIAGNSVNFYNNNFSGTVASYTVQTPATWTVIDVIDSKTVSFFGATTSGIGNGGTAVLGGQSIPGPHEMVVYFITRQGYRTAVSTPIKFWSSGGKKIRVTGVPIGPPNVIARGFGFTGAYGGNFFTIPAALTIPGLGANPNTQIEPTVIFNNLDTSITLNFSDNALFSSTGIDIPGNDLFELITAGPSLGVSFYASRILLWGMKNKLTNLVNMGFDGGMVAGVPAQPLGWSLQGPGGGSLVNASDFGFSWRIIGDGVPADKLGWIQQSAYTDFWGVPIVSPNTGYSITLWISTTSGNKGSIVVELSSALTGFLSTASIDISSLPQGGIADGIFLSADLNLITPLQIPEDLVLNIYAIGQINGGAVFLDEMEIYPTLEAVTNQTLFSYVNNPESFDGVTGLLGPTADSSPMKAVFDFHDTLGILTYQGIHTTRDRQNAEPSDWAVVEVSNRCGCVSPRAVDLSENFVIWVSSPSSVPPTGRGLYLYYGGNAYKISQEIQTYFDQVTPGSEKAIWVCTDPDLHRIYVGLPIGGATACNIILVLDYRELEDPTQIADRPPIRISFTGKMVCTDLSRKWTRWMLSMNCGAKIIRNDRTVQFCVGAGNGVTPGQESGFANVYWFNPQFLTDDDYGQFNPYYTTAFLPSDEMALQLGIGYQRKLYKRYSMAVTGIGTITLTPYASSLMNPRPNTLSLQMYTAQAPGIAQDLGGGLNISTERCAFKIFSTPLPGKTDNSFSLSKFFVTMMKEPISPIRYGAV